MCMCVCVGMYVCVCVDDREWVRRRMFEADSIGRVRAELIKPFNDFARVRAERNILIE